MGKNCTIVNLGAFLYIFYLHGSTNDGHNAALYWDVNK